MLSLLYGPILKTIHDYWKNHNFDYTDLCQQSDVLAFITLSRFVFALNDPTGTSILRTCVCTGQFVQTVPQLCLETMKMWVLQPPDYHRHSGLAQHPALGGTPLGVVMRGQAPWREARCL